MNVLLFTTAMILLLGALTYARLEMYRSLSVLQGEFNQYMATAERGEINQQAQLWYKNSVATKKAGKEGKGGKKTALSRLSFIVFVDAKKREAYNQEYPQLHRLATKLFDVLFKDQRFYPELKEKEEILLRSLSQPEILTIQEQKAPKITRAADLANLDFHAPDLNNLFYKMLQETMTPEKKGGECPLDESKGEEDDDTEEPGKLTEVTSPQGHHSLLDYITLQDASKVRVFLASKPLLTAIFDDPALVQTIIDTRCSLYRNLMNGTLTAEQATQSFQTQFAKSSRDFDETILDFAVSKTNPSKY